MGDIHGVSLLGGSLASVHTPKDEVNGEKMEENKYLNVKHSLLNLKSKFKNNILGCFSLLCGHNILSL